MEKTWDQQIQLGTLKLKNRICMAALTRQRCHPQTGIPNDLLVEYYTQRVDAGIILTQATAWSQRGQAFPGAACLYNNDQAQGWKKVVQSVHQKGGNIFLQMYHAGRATHIKLTRGLQVWGPSPIADRDIMRRLQGQVYPIPIEMSLLQIKQAQSQFEKSVQLAKLCNFDGIQLHGAHGYLIDSFLRSQTNKRTDQYGQSKQNRCRFCLDLIDIALKYYQPQRIGIKISPVSRLNDILDKNPEQTFGYLLQQINKRKIGFVQIRQSSEDFPKTNLYNISPKEQLENVCKTLRSYYQGILIANDSFTSESGLEKIRNNEADMISFGRAYISNPDLATRIIQNKQLEKWDYSTFMGYELGAKGYTDYKKYND